MKKISILMPTKDDSDTLRLTIDSLYSECPVDFDLIVINDASTDNTHQVLNCLKKEYGFKVLNNIENKGKVKSINRALKQANGDIVFIIDSDIRVTSQAFAHMLLALKDNDVGAVSCRQIVRNRGLVPSLENLEYGIVSVPIIFYNISNGLTLYGGFSAYKRKDLEQIGNFKGFAISEDIYSAIELQGIGKKVKMLNTPVYTFQEDNLKIWFKRKIRWASGITQCYLRKPKYIFYSIPFMAFFFAYGFMVNSVFNFLFGKELLFAFLTLVFVSLLTSSLAMFQVEKRRELWKAVPFVLFYYPIFSLVYTFGMIYGVYKTIKIGGTGRGW